jgi:Fe-S cluster assembly iron-binding protein IscA
MAVTLSGSRQARCDFLANRGKGVGVRVAVKTSGCSGLAYVLEFVDDVQPEDQVFDLAWRASDCRSQESCRIWTARKWTL